jgi:disulfide oxidoreductase YuzD
MERRFAGDAVIAYHDVTDEARSGEFSEIVEAIREHGLLYPVTVIDGQPVYDGAVSYPAILRAVQQRLDAPAATT